MCLGRGLNPSHLVRHALLHLVSRCFDHYKQTGTKFNDFFSELLQNQSTADQVCCHQAPCTQTKQLNMTQAKKSLSNYTVYYKDRSYSVI